jgi:hypothetical protein
VQIATAAKVVLRHQLGRTKLSASRRGSPLIIGMAYSLVAGCLSLVPKV